MAFKFLDLNAFETDVVLKLNSDVVLRLLYINFLYF